MYGEMLSMFLSFEKRALFFVFFVVQFFLLFVPNTKGRHQKKRDKEQDS